MSGDTNIKDTLRPYLAQALASYQTFLANEQWSDAKEFSAYHSACKAVLGHISLLAKLTQDKTEITTQDDAVYEWVKKVKNASVLQEDLSVDFD